MAYHKCRETRRTIPYAKAVKNPYFIGRIKSSFSENEKLIFPPFFYVLAHGCLFCRLGYIIRNWLRVGVPKIKTEKHAEQIRMPRQWKSRISLDISKALFQKRKHYFSPVFLCTSSWNFILWTKLYTVHLVIEWEVDATQINAEKHSE